jgi:hypothetical protein
MRKVFNGFVMLALGSLIVFAYPSLRRYLKIERM